MLSRLLLWALRKLYMSRGYEFGPVRFGPNIVQGLPVVPFKHPHMGKVKLFYVDAQVRDKLSKVQE